MGKFRPIMTPAQKKKREEREKKMGYDQSESEYVYPQTIGFNSEQLPEIDNWKPGKDYELCLKARMISYEDRKKEKKQDIKEARFEIVAVKANGISSKQEKIIEDMTGEVGKGE